MEVKNIAIELLEQIKVICITLNNDEYSRPLKVLSNSSLGAHNRHCIEFFIMLMNGKESGIVSYDNRKHDKKIETNPTYAITIIDSICEFLDSSNSDLNMILEVEFPLSGVSTSVKTTFKREIIYNIEHLVHHMALLKIGIREEFPTLDLHPSFGIAQSTIAFHKSNI